MEKAVEFILLKPELQAINQEIVGLTACSIVKSLGGNIDDSRLSKRWDNLFLSQNIEGYIRAEDVWGL